MAAEPQATTSTLDNGPIPMSFPAVLRHTGMAGNPYAHLLERQRPVRTTVTVRMRRRDDNEGKRWIRRKENSRFTHNPHIVSATRRDLSVDPPTSHSTFPEPLPAYLHRNTLLPNAASKSPLDPASANAGRFSTSLKGARKELRRSGWRVQKLVESLEVIILDWMERPQAAGGTGEEIVFPGVQLGGMEIVREVGRSPLKLVWRIPDDAQARFVVHLVARYHEVVSFSRDYVTPEGTTERLTYLLRPNVTRPDFRTTMALETPPTTDIDYASQLDESDFISDSDAESIASGRGISATAGAAPEVDVLASISESRPTSPAISIASDWSAIEASASENEGLAESIDSLSLDDPTPRISRHRTVEVSWAATAPGIRSQSSPSPSRSPSRSGGKRSAPLRFRREGKKKGLSQLQVGAAGERRKLSFYEFVYGVSVQSAEK
ncbi:hypothetical protein DL96DRAFT_1493214 [Flagelloscypha sp. PMI_526]|nr:hypothetical protein DL96DRAFT_1493214 [Flagelloscypha sp. PMI_526]